MKYIASWSGGKDSTASIILAHEHGEPLDEIIFSEVMFDENISGELPEHIEFIHKTSKIFESWGYKVVILHSDKTYLTQFYHIRTRGNHVGMMSGFPMQGRCEINSRCKVKPIKEYQKRLNGDFINYVGIAIDEPKRLARLDSCSKSLLVKYGITEQMALDLCKEYNMLSPIYKYTNRGGCWFCPNMRDNELKHLRDNHTDLYEKLLELEDVPNKIGYCWNILTKTSIHDKEIQFASEDSKK